jgi:nicotinamide-nucleotide amidase
MKNPETLAEQVGAALAARGWMLATAESCTGGWVAKVVTDIAGSSTWFDRGFVTYSNGAKQDMLGVPAALLEAHGAVSEPVVRAMAEGALARSGAHVSVAISGIAGPGGGSPEKPVGMVWFAWGVRGAGTVAVLEHFSGDRNAIREQSVERALRGAWELARRAE